MASITLTGGSSTGTALKEEETVDSERAVLKLSKAKPKQRIKWTDDTVDNEGLGKRKSKSCCQYKKPRAHLDESSDSDSDSDDCGPCPGHKK